MSPEQARGKTVDKRADIWAFGVVLFEMLTGRQVFSGTDISLTLAAVLRQEMDWTELPSGTPHSVRRDCCDGASNPDTGYRMSIDLSTWLAR